jgi:hypothetical protein
MSLFLQQKLMLEYLLYNSVLNTIFKSNAIKIILCLPYLPL